MKKVFETKRVNDPIKKEVNEVIKKLTKVKNRYKGKALILDSAHLLTTNKLTEAGMKKDKIFIPNPYEYGSLKTNHKQTYNMLLRQFLEKYEMDREISVAFFDYMCSVEGNNEIKPIEDIKRYFELKFPANDSLFGVTLSFRGKLAKSQGTYSQVNKIDAVITNEAYNNGYVACKLPYGYAYNGMFFEIFKIMRK